MDTITRSQLAKMLNTAALRDMKVARHDGAIIITHTKLGTVTLSYNTDNKRYSLKDFNDSNTHFVHLHAGVAKIFLKFNVYDVIMDSTVVIEDE